MAEDAIDVVDQAIDRLDDALRVAGFPGLAPAPDPAAVDDVERAITPYSLPRDLCRFWERIDFTSLVVSSYGLPARCNPSGALDIHLLNREPDFLLLFGPPLLFPIARDSGDQWSIELVSRWSSGGAIFSHADAAISIEYPTFTDLLDVYAELIEDGRFVRYENGYAALERDDEWKKQEARLEAARPDPLYGDVREIDPDRAAWPAHWLESAGLDLINRGPLGVTHTIAELAAAADEGPVRARVAGKVVRVSALGGDVLAIVTDGTRSLDIWCPVETMQWGLELGRRFEFEVEVQHPVALPPDLDTLQREVQQHVLAGRFEAAQAAGQTLHEVIANHVAAAVASAVRPLD